VVPAAAFGGTHRFVITSHSRKGRIGAGRGGDAPAVGFRVYGVSLKWPGDDIRPQAGYRLLRMPYGKTYEHTRHVRDRARQLWGTRHALARTWTRAQTHHLRKGHGQPQVEGGASDSSGASHTGRSTRTSTHHSSKGFEWGGADPAPQPEELKLTILKLTCWMCCTTLSTLYKSVRFGTGLTKSVV